MIRVWSKVSEITKLTIELRELLNDPIWIKADIHKLFDIYDNLRDGFNELCSERHRLIDEIKAKNNKDGDA